MLNTHQILHKFCSKLFSVCFFSIQSIILKIEEKDEVLINIYSGFWKKILLYALIGFLQVGHFELSSLHVIFIQQVSQREVCPQGNKTYNPFLGSKHRMQGSLLLNISTGSFSAFLFLIFVRNSTTSRQSFFAARK